MRSRPKRYPYTKSQWEYSNTAFYTFGEIKPYYEMGVKRNKFTGETIIK